MSIYFGIASILFFLLAIIWSKESMLNISIKITLVAMALASVFFLLSSLGYIVKP